MCYFLFASRRYNIMHMLSAVLAVIIISSDTVISFTIHHQEVTLTPKTTLSMSMFDFGSSSNVKIPVSLNDRDNQAISGIKAAVQNYKNMPLIECEFPPLGSLNKLGDGSLRSALQVEEANIAFMTKLVKGLKSPFGPKINVLTSTAASNSFYSKVVSQTKDAKVYSLKDDDLSDKMNKKDICVLITPSSGTDFRLAKNFAASGRVVVIVNAFAKDQNSIDDKATMGYFLKPLTYNSQVAGYLIRSYPNDWTVLDAANSKVLGTFSDAEIRVKGTNTPDLRQAVKLVQSAVDQRAIRARQR